MKFRFLGDLNAPREGSVDPTSATFRVSGAGIAPVLVVPARTGGKAGDQTEDVIMIEIKNILCPVDFSSFSRHALAHAVLIAQWYDATLTVFHAYAAGPPPMLFGGNLGPVPVEPIPVPPPAHEIRQATIGDMKHFADFVRPAGAQMRFEARPGGAVQAILDEAKSLPADFIVLGTHGRGGLDRLVIGSVAEKVLRKAACPVLTVPPPVSAPAADALGLFKRILCPIDYSESSLKALSYGVSLAQEADAQLLLLHVMEGTPDSAYWQQPNPFIVEYLRVSEKEALARLRAVVPEEASTWCQPEGLLGTGKPYREILRVAQERDVHLIVMGVHGRNPLDLMFLGSTTNHVVRAATCPVLTLRS